MKASLIPMLLAAILSSALAYAQTSLSTEAKAGARLRAAAESFEQVTEMSSSAPLTSIDKTIREASTAAQGIRGLLSTNASNQLDAQISAMKSARQNRDRAGLALSSIEAYRILVTTAADDVKVPTEVNLLDYAGFRYDADLKASPARWDDMKEAVAFARQHWSIVSPKVNSRALVTKIDKAIADMGKAAIGRSKSLAATSVKAELDLVDQLETYFLTR